MANFGDLKARVIDELDRDDLADQIEKSILDAVTFYERERFTFNECRSFTDTAEGQEYYELPDDFVSLDNMIIEINARRYPLLERTWQYIEDINWGGTSWQGYPTEYAIYADQFRLYPVPNGIWRLSLSYIRSLGILDADTDENSWTGAGEPMIRCRAKWDVFSNVIRDFEEADRMKAIELDWFASLQRRMTKQVSTNKIRPTAF